MKIYRVLPEPGISLDLADGNFTRELAQWYAPRGNQSLRANFVSTPSGQLAGPDGRSTSLSNPIDRALLKILRSQADAVIVGAETVRTEPVPVPGNAPLVIVSGSGDLAGHKISPGSMRQGGVIILTGAGIAHDPAEFFPPGSASHYAIGGTIDIDTARIRDFLQGLGFDHLLVEGGQRTLERFLDALVVDEIALTLTGPPLVAKQPPLPWWREKWGEWTAIIVATDSARNLYYRFQAPNRAQ